MDYNTKVNGRYAKAITSISDNLVHTSIEIQRSFIEVMEYAIIIVATLPEFFGIWEATGNILFASALASIAALGAHVAITWKQSNVGWIVVGSMLVVAEIVVFSYSHYTAMLYPPITIFGALIVGMKERATVDKAQAEQDRIDKRNKKLADDELARRIKYEKHQSKLSDSAQASAQPVHNGVHDVISHLNEHYKGFSREEIKISDLAAHFGVHRNTMSKRLKSAWESAGYNGSVPE